MCNCFKSHPIQSSETGELLRSNDVRAKNEVCERVIIRCASGSRETMGTYKKRLQLRKQEKKKWNKGLIRPEVNGFIKIDHSTYLD